jgi:hypothetical protein
MRLCAGPIEHVGECGAARRERESVSSCFILCTACNSCDFCRVSFTAINLNVFSESILMDRAETVLHDHFGDVQYWRARRSMRYSVELRRIADDFRRTQLASDDKTDGTVLGEDWSKTEVGTRLTIFGRINDCARSDKARTGDGRRVPGCALATERLYSRSRQRSAQYQRHCATNHSRIAPTRLEHRVCGDRCPHSWYFCSEFASLDCIGNAYISFRNRPAHLISSEEYETATIRSFVGDSHEVYGRWRVDNRSVDLRARTVRPVVSAASCH